MYCFFMQKYEFTVCLHLNYMNPYKLFLQNISFVVALSAESITVCPGECVLAMRYSCFARGQDKMDTRYYRY